MAEKKIIQMLLEECDRVEGRCAGYRGEIAETVADIIELENQHKLAAMNIKQKISDQISRVGSDLAKTREE